MSEDIIPARASRTERRKPQQGKRLAKGTLIGLCKNCKLPFLGPSHNRCQCKAFTQACSVGGMAELVFWKV